MKEKILRSPVIKQQIQSTKQSEKRRRMLSVILGGVCADKTQLSARSSYNTNTTKS
jgi:hypothetical protein